LAYISAAESIGVSSINHFYVIRPQSYRILSKYVQVRAIVPFEVSQGHQVLYHTNRKPICDILLVLVLLHHFQDTAFERSKIAIFGYPYCV